MSAWTVAEALAALPLQKPLEGAESPVPFFHLLERLKLTKRQGWRRHGIMNGESVADHMHRMSVLALFAPENLDRDKCIRLCLIHDLAESIVGDITPADNISKPEKNRRETETMAHIRKSLAGVDGTRETADEILGLWTEFEECKSPESIFVQDLDKLELLLQMSEYEARGNGTVNLEEFAYVATKLRLPEVQSWAEEILNGRREFRSRVESGEGKPQTTRDQQDQYYGE